MRKTHANGLSALIRQKERYHNPDLKITIEKGQGKTDYQVIVEANKALIDTMMDDHASYEYLDNKEHRRQRLAPNKMRFF